jgi:lysophospholipase L1-like esterase
MRFPGRPILLVAALGIAFVAGELGLRAAGFAFEPTLESVEFGWPNTEVREARYASDPDLFWVPRDYPERLARLAGARPDLLFLGDSVTEWGRWPRLLIDLLRRTRAETPLVAATLGTAGWSSYQGLQQLRRDVLPLRPRVVVLWFGWNDHWRGMGVDDASVHEISRPRVAWLRKLRWEQLWLKARLAWRARGGAAPERVPPDDFRANLVEMARRAREADSLPVLVTAPSGHEPGREPLHLAPRWIEDLSRLVPLHRRYVEIVREVARDEGVLLCDLAARFEALPAAERAQSFAADGIHLTRIGDRRAAAWLFECFEASSALRAQLAAPRG